MDWSLRNVVFVFLFALVSGLYRTELFPCETVCQPVAGQRGP